MSFLSSSAWFSRSRWYFWLISGVSLWSCSQEPEVVRSTSDAAGGSTATGGASSAGGSTETAVGGTGGSAPGGEAGAESTGGAKGGNGGIGSSTDAAGVGGTGGTVAVIPDEPQLTFSGVQLPGATNVTDFGFIPGTSNELLVLMHDGTVIHYRRESEGAFTELGRSQIDDIFYDEGCGLLSLAFDPEFEDNRFVYLARCKEQTVTRIARFEFDDITELPDTEVDILSVEADVAAEDWHRFGSIGFEPDGETMWALLGDLFLSELAQDTSHKGGSLLRFKPDRTQDGSGYAPASGNAFSDAADGDPSIYAYGFRSPWRGTRDRFGRFWVGDVGLVTTEEVNLVMEPGQNFGWARSEGPCVADCDGLTQPLTHYGRVSDEPYVIDDPLTEPATKRAIWVGQAYYSDKDRYFGLFDDAVMFGDFFTGWVRRLEVDETGALIGDRLVGHLTQITSWKTGPDGYMYVVTLPGGFYRATQVVE